jgi:uncharacterized membrane protein
MMIFWSISLIVVVVVLLRLAPRLRSSTVAIESPIERLQHR